MKRGPELQQHIRRLRNQYPKMPIATLARVCRVSEPTVRRALNPALAEKHKAINKELYYRKKCEQNESKGI